VEEDCQRIVCCSLHRFAHHFGASFLFFESRTFKDVITFIPVVIILIIPLSPVGHVLVFGAIQRFFPDFFPSCFTEQRQNLLQLYENAEYTEIVINENWKVGCVAKDAEFVGWHSHGNCSFCIAGETFAPCGGVFVLCSNCVAKSLYPSY
jgi:hypothetical protein